MTVRVIVHEENLARIDATPVLRRLQHEVVEDAKAIVPVRTGALRASIRAGDVDRDSAIVLAGGGPVDYPVYVELGTRHMAAQPYLKPALYRRRSL